MKTLIALLLLGSVCFAQQPNTPPDSEQQQIRALQRRLQFQQQEMDVAQKKADDVLWHLKLGDVANVDKVRIASSKPVRMSNTTG